MLSKKTLQTKLLVSVFIIVSLTVISITAVMTFIEKNRYQQTELNRIYYETHGLKKRLGDLMYGQNFRYLKITLSNTKRRQTQLSCILYSLIRMERS